MHGQADLILKGEARKGAPCWTALGIIPATPVLFRPSLACPPLHDPAGTTLEWLVCLSMHTGGSPCATDLNKRHFQRRVLGNRLHDFGCLPATLGAPRQPWLLDSLGEGVSGYIFGLPRHELGRAADAQHGLDARSVQPDGALRHAPHGLRDGGGAQGPAAQPPHRCPDQSHATMPHLQAGTAPRVCQWSSMTPLFLCLCL